MSVDIARTRTALAREIVSLEEFLASDPDWQALHALEIATGLSMPPQLDSGAALGLPENLREALIRNPVFQARARLYEALGFLLAPELTSDAPSTSNVVATIEPSKAVFPALDAAERVNAALARLAERARLSQRLVREKSAEGGQPSILPEPAPAVAQERGAIPAKDAASPASNLMAVIDEERDDLRLIAFIDDQVAAQLNASGILRFSDIAHFTVDQVAVLSVRFGLGNRIIREKWIEQAAVLASGHTTAYASQMMSGDRSSAGTTLPERDTLEPLGLDEPLDELLPVTTSLTDQPAVGLPSVGLEPHSGYADFDFANLRIFPAAPQPGETSPEETSSPVSFHASWQAEPEQPIVPPPLPPACKDWPPLLVPDNRTASFEDDTSAAADDYPEVSDVWIVPRLDPSPERHEMPQPSLQVPSRFSEAGHEDGFLRRRPREDGPLLRNPVKWEPIEEAAVEIVPRSAPFPGVGPVSQAVTRLQSAVEPPAPAFSRLLRAFQRR